MFFDAKPKKSSHFCCISTDQSRVALEEVLNSGKSHMKQLTWTIY